ncbi:VCBS repeat-containing protein [Arthrobacter sp. FW305-123]|nr:VCBS repeat-containing protein [Arthrobacter sp. FW305-123]
MGNFRLFAVKAAAFGALLMGSTAVGAAPAAADARDWVPPMLGMPYVGSELTIGKADYGLQDCQPTADAPHGFVMEWLSNGEPLPAERQGEFLKLLPEDQGNRISFNVHGVCSESEVFHSGETAPIAASTRSMGWTGRGNFELLGRTNDGNLVLYPHVYTPEYPICPSGAGCVNYTHTSETPRVIGRGFNIFDIVFSTGDFDGDGNNDLLGRDRNGTLHIYPGDGSGGWLPPSQIGWGWNIFDTVVGPGDFDGDGNNDVLARDTAGDLYLYPGDGDGGWLAPSHVGTGWDVMNKLVTPGDTDGDGAVDIYARDQAGLLHQYPADGNGGWKAPSIAGHGWELMAEISGAGVYERIFGFRYSALKPLNDIVAIDETGDLRLFSNSEYGAGLFGNTHIGTGWGIFNTLI